MKKDKTTLVTGGFDPLHKGHIYYFESAKKLTGNLVVGINSDQWLVNKKGYSFMGWEDRAEIIRNLEVVDKVIEFNDENGSANDAIRISLEEYQNVFFANGGDREKNNIPELDEFKDDKRVTFNFGVGGNNKANSSSWIINDFISNFIKTSKLKENIDSYTEAPWGHHVALFEDENYKLKELVVKPSSKLSLQYHHHRSEHWIVIKGKATVKLGDDTFDVSEGNYVFIPKGETHRLINNTNQDLMLIEIQTGEILEESDIVRIEDSYNRV